MRNKKIVDDNLRFTTKAMNTEEGQIQMISFLSQLIKEIKRRRLLSMK